MVEKVITYLFLVVNLLACLWMAVLLFYLEWWGLALIPLALDCLLLYLIWGIISGKYPV